MNTIVLPRKNNDFQDSPPVLKNCLTINLRSQRRSKMYPNTMKNDVYSSTKTSQNADGTKNCKTHFQRRSPTQPFWSQVHVFSKFGVPAWPGWLPKWAPRHARTLQKLHQSSSRRKNRPNQLPGGSRKVPRHPKGPPRHHVLMSFGLFPKAILE